MTEVIPVDSFQSPTDHSPPGIAARSFFHRKSPFESIIFAVPVDTDIMLELRITFLSRQGASLRVIAPEKFAGTTIGLPHIPFFGMPTIFGYYYAGRLTSKCTSYIVEFTQMWYAKRQAVVDRLPEIREYLAVGLSLPDVEKWIGSETRMCYRYGEFQKIVNEMRTELV